MSLFIFIHGKVFPLLHYAQVLYLRQLVIRVKTTSGPVRSQATSASASKMQDWKEVGTCIYCR